MSRKTFHDILSRYLEGKCTAEEKATVELWYQMLDQETAGFTREELLSVENKLWDKIHQQLTMPKHLGNAYAPGFFAGKRSILQLAILAGFAVIVNFVFFYFTQKQPDFNVAATNPAIIHCINNTAFPKSVYLQDGSYVRLKPGSALTYPKQFTKQNREVYLTGEAYFLVSKNPQRPFLVYNSNTITRVVGTSFIIKTDNHSNRTEVSVQTGKVIVTENTKKNLLKTVWNKPDEVILTPNQKTTYSDDNERFKTTLVALPLPVNIHNKAFGKPHFVYNQTPVSSVLNALNKTYGIEIIGTKEVKEATFTGNLDEMGLYDELEMICQSIHATYQLSGTKIYIK